MLPPARNYRLLTVLIITIVAGILYLNFTSMFSFLFWLPVGDIGFLRQPTAQQIIQLDVRSQEQMITFEESGTYRIFSPRRTLTYRNLIIEAVVDGQIITLTQLTNYYEAYNTELIKGTPLFDIQIDQPGIYKIYTVDSTINSHSLLIAPDYSAQNKIRTTLVLAIPVLGFLLYLYITSRPVAPKAKRQEKRNKFDELL